MNRLIDIVRMFFISPEMLCLMAPIGLWIYWPAPEEFIASQINGDLKWGLGAVLVPAGFLATCYQLGTHVLSPQGTRRVILEWPDYWMLKNRVVLALVFCIVAISVVFIGWYLIAQTQASFGATIILAGWLSSAAALSSVALARWKIREFFGE